MHSHSLEINRRVLVTLTGIYADVVALEFELRLNGDEDKADNLSDGTRRLEKRLRKLRGNMLADWPGQARDLRQRVQNIACTLHTALQDVQDDVHRETRLEVVLEGMQQLNALAGELKGAD